MAALTRTRAGRVGEESPGSTENTVPGNARRGRPQGQCHRKQTAGHGPRARGPPARVKGCGKSAPRCRQRQRHGKPHREQDQIGTTRPGPRPARRVFRAVVRVGRARRPVTDVPEEWSSPATTAAGTEPGLQAVWHHLRDLRSGRWLAPIPLQHARTIIEQTAGSSPSAAALSAAARGDSPIWPNRSSQDGNRFADLHLPTTSRRPRQAIAPIRKHFVKRLHSIEFH